VQVPKIPFEVACYFPTSDASSLPDRLTWTLPMAAFRPRLALKAESRRAYYQALPNYVLRTEKSLNLIETEHGLARKNFGHLLHKEQVLKIPFAIVCYFATSDASYLPDHLTCTAHEVYHGQPAEASFAV
jgi:hypothetical protein